MIGYKNTIDLFFFLLFLWAKRNFLQKNLKKIESLGWWTFNNGETNHDGLNFIAENFIRSTRKKHFSSIKGIGFLKMEQFSTHLEPGHWVCWEQQPEGSSMFYYCGCIHTGWQMPSYHMKRLQIKHFLFIVVPMFTYCRTVTTNFRTLKTCFNAIASLFHRSIVQKKLTTFNDRISND